MSHDVSHQITGSKRRIKDSLLLILIFCIGLAGLCYILHVSASNPNATSHHMDQGYDTSETLYFTSNR